MTDANPSSRWAIATIDDIKGDESGSVAIGPFGSRMKSDLYVADGVPVIMGRNLSDTRSFKGPFVFVSDATADGLRSSIVHAGDLVFPHRGSIGSVGIVPNDGHERYMLSTSLMKLRCNIRIADPDFVFYFFRSPQGRSELLKYASTVGTPGIGQPLTSLRSVQLPLPPVTTQREIASVLLAFDNKIDSNTRLAGLIEARLSAIFAAYSFDDPGDGSQTLDGLIEVGPVRTKPSQTTAPYIDMAALPTYSALVDRADMRAPTSGSRFINGDTVMARITPCLENGKIGFIDCLSDSEVGVGSTEFIVLRPHEALPLQFAYFLARSDRFRDYAVRHMSGSSGRQRCPAEAISRYSIRSPGREALAVFADEAAPAFEMLRAFLNESILLRRIRDALLPRLVSGELRVRDVESQVEAAV